jgi:hypothetical protein
MRYLALVAALALCVGSALADFSASLTAAGSGGATIFLDNGNTQFALGGDGEHNLDLDTNGSCTQRVITATYSFRSAMPRNSLFRLKSSYTSADAGYGGSVGIWNSHMYDEATTAAIVTTPMSITSQFATLGNGTQFLQASEFANHKPEGTLFDVMNGSMNTSTLISITSVKPTVDQEWLPCVGADCPASS